MLDLRAPRAPARILPLVVGLVLLAPLAASGQVPDSDERPASRESRSGTRFASFDVGFGAAFPDEARTGISYGVGVDVADLLIRGAAIRFGFRFWTSEDLQADGRVVDIDDTVFSISVKRALPLGSADAYIGIGVAGHFVSARYEEFLDPDGDERDGFHPGLEGLAGLEIPVVDRGFVSIFAEGQGSLLADLPHGSLHAGVRIRFDRLGTGG
jgi:hypothetical protein